MHLTYSVELFALSQTTCLMTAYSLHLLLHTLIVCYILLCFLYQYVPEELMPVYRDQLIPLADIITPNQFEAE